MPALSLLTATVVAQLAVTLPRVPLPAPRADAAVAQTHDNHTRAGVLANGTLQVAIDVVYAAWRPEGNEAPAVPILAFAIRDSAPLVPGPLLRAARGTRLALSLRNRTDSAIVIWGLGRSADRTDSVQLAPRSERTISAMMRTSGTYYYWGAFRGSSFDERLWLDSQLNGALVVDEPGAPNVAEEVLVLSEWFHPYEENRVFEVVSVINGRAWPHSQRLTIPRLRTTRFRVINALPLYHPLHLHGAYFSVEGEGNGRTHRPFAAGREPVNNTRLIKPGGTMTLRFRLETPGNWLFHCHFSFHMDETVSLRSVPRDSAQAAHEAQMHAARASRPVEGESHPHGGGTGTEEHMRGLVIGITVPPDSSYREPSRENARAVRLLVQKRPGRLITGATAYGFVLQRDSAAPKPDSVELPGAVLELRRGQPVRITVVNTLDEPTGVHWHGLEIPSFPDGVPGWSGMGSRILPPIAPRDSFVAEFTPPRSGTFPYHSHLNERHQIQSGLYGALVVTDTPRDPTRDHLIVAGGGGPSLEAKVESPFALVNGRRTPGPIRLRVGETHRLRLLSVHPDWRVVFTMRGDPSIEQWRPVAKDGFTMSPTQSVAQRATVTMGPGETADYTVTPRVAGEYMMEIRSAEAGWFIPLPIIVEPARGPKGR